jgi:3-oxosteroid 1-dehydrogenase
MESSHEPPDRKDAIPPVAGAEGSPMNAWDESVDLVVIGSGGGGLCAAMAARSQGASVLVLEKTDKLGGSTAMSGGVLWVPDNPLMKREGVPDSAQDARRYLDAAVGHEDCGPGATHARRSAFLESAPKVVEFLEAAGMPFIRAEGWSDYYDELPGGSQRGRSIGTPLIDSAKLGCWGPLLRMGPIAAPLTVAETRFIGEATRTMRGRLMLLRMAWRILWMRRTKRRLLGLGASLQGHMLLAAERLEVPIRRNAGVVSLVQQGGAVTGVVAMIEGGERRIQARKGVLIASGGFAHNEEMRRQYSPKPTSTKWTNANPGETGEMILAAQKAGAELAMMDEAWWIPSSMLPSGAVGMHSTDLGKPHCMLVDSAGQRFTNESGSYVDNGHRMYERNKATPSIPCWLILESRHRSRYNFGFQPPMVTPEAWLTSGYMKKADTLEDLARQCGIDAAGLVATAKRFSGFAATGVDEDFGRGNRSYDRTAGDPTVKPNPNLGAIEKAPFYAVAIYPGDVGTQGGIVTDERARALRADGSVIRGLYAAGNCTASVMGRKYPGAGASIAASFVFAWLAARDALATPAPHEVAAEPRATASAH